MSKFLPHSQLSTLQCKVLEEFFARDQNFFLTGGAALAGFFLGHRQTDDLDLFTSDQTSFDQAPLVLQSVATALGATLAVRQHAPGFRRVVLTTEKLGSVVVDFVYDQGVAAFPDKQRFGNIVVDPVAEILINKLTAVVGRAEERDLVDLLCLANSGLSIIDNVAAAQAKDGGCTPANLAWLLSEVHIPDDIQLPAQVSPVQLRTFVAQLIVKLRQLALPIVAPA